MAWNGRYILLIFDCMLVVGIYFCTDIPSALQSQIEMPSSDNCTEEGAENSTCCIDCLGLGATQYNLLYTVYSWTSSVMILPVGFVIDRMGNRISAVLFTGIATTGSLLFAIGSVPGIRNTSLMFPLMMIGRLFIGAGTGSSRIVRDRVIASWFPDRLALAFGIAVSTMGLGSVLTFLLTSNIAKWIGLSATLFVGAGVCSTCFISALCLCYLDWYGTRHHSDTKVTIRAISAANISTIKQLPRSFWLISVMIATYYSFQLPFTANGSKYIREKYRYTKTDSSYINGVIYDVSVVISPFVGLLLDRFGKRGWVAFLGAILTLPMGPILLYTDVPPLPVYIWIGVMFTATVVALWSAIPHVVPHSAVGTANGIASCMLDLTVGSTNLLVGRLLSKGETQDNSVNINWPYVFLVMFGFAFICAVSGVIINVGFKRKTNTINRKPLKRERSILDTDKSENTDHQYTQSVYSIYNDIIIENKASDMWRRFSSRKQYEDGTAKCKKQKSLFIDLDNDNAIEIKITLTDKNILENSVTNEDQLEHYSKLVNDIFKHVTNISFENDISEKMNRTS
ncbi:major facilitator superfamily domain-containing protein 1-like [Ruditapes philippinarum]|uniref:major facilitator superfamily domain-containing protein 1-like n=1 Tax=Ruditapes philippinarum TaxID=129788 RepID=UPI00295B462C|nr:major facilitator superfamily domain-containing protein 1-like [Ruditapes philippinarum]